jgi:hypothetical protein
MDTFYMTLVPFFQPRRSERTCRPYKYGKYREPLVFGTLRKSSTFEGP